MTTWGYMGLTPKFDHQSVKHSAEEYVRGDVYTNTVESSFALLKRGIMGTSHQCQQETSALYLAEFDHRWNHRKTTDGERTEVGLGKVEGKRLTYRGLVFGGATPYLLKDIAPPPVRRRMRRVGGQKWQRLATVLTRLGEW